MGTGKSATHTETTVIQQQQQPSREETHGTDQTNPNTTAHIALA
jgi:hypothetical protein